MARITDTVTFPNTIPALDDHVIGTDVSDTGNSAEGEAVTFKFSDIFDIIPTPTVAAHIFDAQIKNYSTFDGLDDWGGIEVELAYTMQHFGVSASVGVVEIQFSNDGSNWYGTTNIIYNNTTGTSSGTAMFLVDFASAAYLGFESGFAANSISGTISGLSTSVTHFRIRCSANSNERVAGIIRVNGGRVVF